MSIPPVHNYEKQVVFSNREHNISPNDIINWTIATSADNTYFDLYKSRMTLKLKITGLTSKTTDTTFTVLTKKNMSGIVNNTKVTYTYFNPENDSLCNLVLNADNENIGQIRSILNTISNNKHDNNVNESLKELSYIYFDEAKEDDIPVVARQLKRPYGGKLFFNEITFTQKANTTVAYSTININFSDIFEGCGQQRFINLCQMDAEIILQDKTNYFNIIDGKLETRSAPEEGETDEVSFSDIFIDSCYLWYHNYKSNNDDDFDPEDTEIPKNQIMTKTFKIPQNQGFLDDRIICNFPIKQMYIMFTDNEGNFSSLQDVKFKKIAMNIAGEQKRIIDVDNNNNPDGKDHTFFEWMDYLCNARSDEYSTLLTYKTWRDQFKIYGFPIAEWWPQRSSNQIQFEMEFDNSYNDAPNLSETLQMHVIMIRANQVIS